MTSVDLIVVLVVGALVGALTGIAIGQLVDDLYLAVMPDCWPRLLVPSFTT